MFMCGGEIVKRTFINIQNVFYFTYQKKIYQCDLDIDF